MNQEIKGQSEYMNYYDDNNFNKTDDLSIAIEKAKQKNHKKRLAQCREEDKKYATQILIISFIVSLICFIISFWLGWMLIIHGVMQFLYGLYGYYIIYPKEENNKYESQRTNPNNQ